MFWIDSEGTQEPATVPNENALTTSAQSRIGKYYWLIDLQLIISMSKSTTVSLIFIWILIWLIEKCQTISGRDPFKPCVFPFTYKGITYNACTKDHSMGGNFWCGTAPEVNSVYAWESGDCNDECPSTSVFK